jgi:hypothetical protein
VDHDRRRRRRCYGRRLTRITPPLRTLEVTRPGLIPSLHAGLSNTVPSH